MIIGKILENEKKIRFNIDITCTNCGKKVPGGMKAGEQFYKSKEFKKELEEFTRTYLCGICRDKKRTTQKQS